MGIDGHVLNFLRYAANRKPLGAVATIGRQELLFQPEQFCESLLMREFGATVVHSYDYSGFEGATHIADFNLPLIPERQYDTVLDGGTLEHVFNIPQALKNVWALCKLGGQILHVSPANNFCGHGFWQMSPELFFSLYPNAEVFLANTRNTRHWFEVQRPTNGKRAEVVSSARTYVLCRAIKTQEAFPESVQQSDYVAAWNGQPKRSALKNNEFVVHLHRRIFRALSRLNPNLAKRIVRGLITAPDSNSQSESATVRRLNSSPEA